MFVPPLVGSISGVNVALTVFAAFIVSVQTAVPEQSPDHPTNVAPPKAVAMSVIVEPAVNCTELLLVPSGVTEQELPPWQVSPPGDDTTLPLPMAPRPPLMVAEKLSR